jgi:protein arginine kinase activator
MLCQACNKKTATVHVTEIIDNQPKEQHLCQGCAAKKQITSEALTVLLAGLLDIEKTFKKKEGVLLKCPACNLTQEDFKKTGKLGCSKCYETFYDILAPLLKKIHGTDQHKGKMPSKGMVTTQLTENQIVMLKERLEVAVQQEKFEEAARLRDEIKNLQSSKNKTDKKE